MPNNSFTGSNTAILGTTALTTTVVMQTGSPSAPPQPSTVSGIDSFTIRKTELHTLTFAVHRKIEHDSAVSCVMRSLCRDGTLASTDETTRTKSC